VARFAHAPVRRVLLAGLIFGVITGLSVSWLAARFWAPVIDEAVAALPPTSSIQGGTLRWPERSGRLLAANQFLSFEVVLNEVRSDSAPVDLAFEFRPDRLGLRSLFGSAAVPYPRNVIFKLNRTALVPTWGAWRGPAIFVLIPGTALLLVLSWSLLAIPYAVVARGIAGLFGRELSLPEAWKLCVAAQLPGCILMIFAISLYASGQVSVLFILIMFVAHFIPTVLYLLISPLLVPKKARGAALKSNPFDREGETRMSGRNPFATSED
jgi:hypothetical protein